MSLKLYILALAFLKANMPIVDVGVLTPAFLKENTHLACHVMDEVPWGKDIPQDIFLNYILPYASVNERRDSWREDFHHRFIKIAIRQKTIDQAAIVLNRYVFKVFHVSYNLSKRSKPDQSPYETIQSHYASCTGLSILLIDALRSVGIPARLVATPMWADNSGNHTWVEIWDEGKWHYLGADESNQLDHAWFTDKAAHADRQHPIYAVSFKKTPTVFPMRWAEDITYISAIDVTDSYCHSKS